MDIPEKDVDRATRLLDTLTAIGTESICVEVVLGAQPRIISGSADQRWMALPRRSRGQTRTTRGVNDPPRRATGVSRVLACCVGTPVVSHRCFTLPRSSILCGCINFPCRQVNAVWGRYPTACTVYVTKKTWSVSPGARRQNLSRLRVEKLGCAGSRQVIPAILYEVSADKSASISNQAGHRVPLTYLCVAPPGQSPAYTYLKQPWQPLQVFVLSQSLFCLLLQPILT